MLFEHGRLAILRRKRAGDHSGFLRLRRPREGFDVGCAATQIALVLVAKNDVLIRHSQRYGAVVIERHRGHVVGGGGIVGIASRSVGSSIGGAGLRQVQNPAVAAGPHHLAHPGDTVFRRRVSKHVDRRRQLPAMQCRQARVHLAPRCAPCQQREHSNNRY
ncbi:hypothetical protein D3C85_965020 [compost metagenome]